MEDMQPLNSSSSPSDDSTSAMASNLQQTGSQLQEKGRHYFEAGKNYINQALDNPRMSEFKSKAGDWQSQLNTQVRDKPLRSIALGVAAGFLFGRMFRR